MKSKEQKYAEFCFKNIQIKKAKEVLESIRTEEELRKEIEKLNKVIHILTNILDLKVNDDYQSIQVSNCFNFYVEIEEDYEFLKEVLDNEFVY